ncbi:hypothetical protein [Flavobacterium sp. SORGH_AS_0622]|uniref:hypothetical protein n=1 Tax=Flavobacterium sp. SORGH_AS_0622 TaxID=3041772 RepID=UPI0027889C89|nr:hypothetical protein [Flavobacterium sp. SORGH_AS_0622]MDQ1164665.1 hypothetical protein [Flavobacterium sp. SORGH_AS_0622]
MNKIYPLEWFDLIISQKLAPENQIAESLSKQDFTILSEHIEKESKNIQNYLKREIFLLRRKREVRLQVRKYHSTVIYLLDIIIEYQKSNIIDNSQASSLYQIFQAKLEELLLVIESRFSDFLGLDERVPITYLMLSRSELELKLKKLSANAYTGLHGRVLEIVVKNLSQLLERFSGRKITYRQLLYQKELLTAIKNIDKSTDINIFSNIDKLLIEKNFNSSEYANYIIEHINNEIDDEQSIPYRITRLLFYQKEFVQIYSNENMSFDPSRNNIKAEVGKWFELEIYFLERKLELLIKADVHGISEDTQNADKDSKIECDLSADQLALILRAADESRIVKARSMNYFFRMIIPYLSTPFKKELSYKSVRSKSYNAEDRDKDIAVETLQKIIKKINTY